MSDGYEKIEECGSLALSHFEGNEKEPETYLVTLTENPRVQASLQAAADFFELNNGNAAMRLNGSQVQTVKAWVAEYL